MRYFIFSALLALGGCTDSVCFERGQPAGLPIPHAGII